LGDPTVPVTVYAVELHTHSRYSHDGRDSVPELLEAAERVGLDAIAVTDHDTVDGGLEVASLAEDYGLLGIPGIEVTSNDGHVLGLGVRTPIAAGQTFAETLSSIRDAGGIAIVPHPFQESRHGVLASIDEAELATADAIEVYNSRLITGRANRQAASFADRVGVPATAGSDAHVSEMVGRAVTNVDAANRTVDDILDAIVAGRTTTEGRRTPWLLSLRQAAGNARRRLQRGVDGLLR
jgi:predicted metal-dependent phosphoesterase TrpH